MKSLITANWWHYDNATRTLFYETTEDGVSRLNKLICKISAGEAENSWLAIPMLQLEPNNDARVILWEDQEFSPGKDLVVMVKDWHIQSPGNNTYTLGVICVLASQLTWVWEAGLPTMSLIGHYSDGTPFEDTLRLIIPFENGSALAIGSKERRYFLQASKGGIMPVPVEHNPKKTTFVF